MTDTVVPVTSRDLDAAEVSWFSALCSDDYQFLGVPDGDLRSSWEHCRDIGLEAERQGFRNLLAPSAEQASHPDDELANVLRDRRRRLGPQVFVIRPVPDALLFDRTELTVVAGHPVEIVFDNTDLMPHDLLVAAPGSLAVVGMAAEKMAQDPDAWDKGFVPDLPEVLHTTGLLQFLQCDIA